jgi:hypothetical protein
MTAYLDDLSEDDLDFLGVLKQERWLLGREFDETNRRQLVSFTKLRKECAR